SASRRARRPSGVAGGFMMGGFAGAAAMLTSSRAAPLRPQAPQEQRAESQHRQRGGKFESAGDDSGKRGFSANEAQGDSFGEDGERSEGAGGDRGSEGHRQSRADPGEKNPLSQRE